jgi:hypothetical protein
LINLKEILNQKTVNYFNRNLPFLRFFTDLFCKTSNPFVQVLFYINDMFVIDQLDK